MPTYQFKCIYCGYACTEMLSIKGIDAGVHCPHCGSLMKRIISPVPGFVH